MIHNVQVLRGLAALLVILAHLRDVFLAAGLSRLWPGIGYAGVDVFFVISGFIMVHTTLASSVTGREFLARRTARVVPLYWLLTLGVYAIALLAPSLLNATSSDPWQLVQSLLFIPFAKADGGIAPVLYVGWSLNFEMLFYALFAAGLALPRRWTVPATVACIAGLVAVGQIAKPEVAFWKFYTNEVMLEFVWGMLLGLLYPSLPARRSPVLAAVAGAAVVVGAPLACWMVISEPFRPIGVGLPAAAVVGGALVLEKMGYSAKNAWGLLLGDVSYAVYLTHPFVAAVVVKIATKMGVGGVPQAVAITAFTFAACAVTGWFVHAWVEKPLTQRAMSLVRRPVAVPAG